MLTLKEKQCQAMAAPARFPGSHIPAPLSCPEAAEFSSSSESLCSADRLWPPRLSSGRNKLDYADRTKPPWLQSDSKPLQRH